LTRLVRLMFPVLLALVLCSETLQSGDAAPGAQSDGAASPPEKTPPTKAGKKTAPTGDATVGDKSPARNKPQPQKRAEAGKFAGGEGEWTAAREAAALQFARDHHPELADLLPQLKASNKREYMAALRELARTSERLARVRDRSAERYEVELQAWQLDSQIRLLAARLTMSDRPELEAELKQLLRQRVAVRLKQRQLQRDDLSRQLVDLTAEIEQLEADPDAVADSQFKKLQSGFLKSDPRRRKAVRDPSAAAPVPAGNAANKTPTTSNAKVKPQSVRGD